MAFAIRPRSRSVFQNYQNLQAWQQVPEQAHCNLLQRLNKNLSTYENKYRKYIIDRQNQLKQSQKLILQNIEEIKGQTTHLPQLNVDHNFVTQSQNMKKQKVIVSQSQQKEIKDSQIFCQRSNNNFKLKTISFDKQSKPRHPIQHRKLSLHQRKPPSVQKFFNKQNLGLLYQRSKPQGSPLKLDMSSKLQSYKQLRYRLKKAANKSKIFHEEKVQKKSENQNQLQKKLFKKHSRKLSTVFKDIENQGLGMMTNQFSDKNFFEKNIRQRYQLHR